MSQGIHCDGPACETWAKPNMAHDSGFLTVMDGVYYNHAEFFLHFCSWDCMMKYAAFKQPLDRID